MSHEELQELERKDTELLAIVKEQVSVDLFKSIGKKLDESGYYYGYEIIDEPIGELNDEPDNDYLMYVDQTSGYFGDDWSGTCCIQLPCKKYFKWSFNM